MLGHIHIPASDPQRDQAADGKLALFLVGLQMTPFAPCQAKHPAVAYVLKALRLRGLLK